MKTRDQLGKLAAPASWPSFFGSWRLENMRAVILHVITETACHAGHLDAARELELPQRTLESYLRQNIDFSLDEENRRGLELYFTRAAKLGLIPQAKPLEWAVAKAEAVKS